jgi:hypothetical protein
VSGAREAGGEVGDGERDEPEVGARLVEEEPVSDGGEDQRVEREQDGRAGPQPRRRGAHLEAGGGRREQQPEAGHDRDREQRGPFGVEQEVDPLRGGDQERREREPRPPLPQQDADGRGGRDAQQHDPAGVA